MTQPKAGKPAPTTPAKPGTDAPAKPDTDDLAVTSAEWPTKAQEPPHPVLSARLQESWAARKESNGKVLCPAFALVAKDDAARTTRERQIRHAATVLGLGVSIKVTKSDSGEYRMLFRARPKRKTAGKTA